MPKESQPQDKRAQDKRAQDKRATKWARRPEAEVVPRNEVLLVGRVSAAPQERTLPSGDVLVSWRVVVQRPLTGRPTPAPAPTSASGRVTTVDAFDCVAWGAGVRRTVGSWAVGDVVQVEGALRRRFWRSPGGATSRHEVEVRAARRVQRAA
jgi:single-strand DNA-binding protein